MSEATKGRAFDPRPLAVPSAQVIASGEAAGTINAITLSADSAVVTFLTIPHGLGYVPLFGITWRTGLTDQWTLGNYTDFAPGPAAQGSGGWFTAHHTRWKVDETNLYGIYVVILKYFGTRPAAPIVSGRTVWCRWFVFANPAENIQGVEVVLGE